MTDRTDLDRRLEGWLHTDGPGPVSPDVVRAALVQARTRHQQQRLSWRPFRQGSLVLVAGLLVALGAATAAVVGNQPSPAPDQAAFVATGSMAVARVDHTATLLADGQVLVAGGSRWNRGSPVHGGLTSAELYDPVTGTFGATGSMGSPREAAAATLLLDGRVLITGGHDDGSTAETYDPRTGTFTPTGPMLVDRYDHTATLLPGGMVLVAGGQGLVSLRAEIFDPKLGRFTATGPMTKPRYRAATATKLLDGTVLLAGGVYRDASAEIFDPKLGTFTATGPMTVSRERATATLLADGQVLITGGVYADDEGSCVADRSAELYDPVTRLFTATGPLVVPRYRAAAASLPDGRVLIIGGDAAGTAEVYDPASGTFSMTSAMVDVRYLSTATVLQDGSVLAIGGKGPMSPSCVADPLSSGELYR
jgi:Galactose oxidase, central domain